MKKYQKILLASLSAIILIAGGLCLWQKDNLKALYLFATNNGKQIEQTLSDERKNTEDILTEHGVTVKGLTPEQEASLINGNLTVEDALKEIEASLKKSEGTEAADEQETPTEKTEASEKPSTATQAENITNRAVAQLYGHKARFLGSLGGLYSSASSQYLALPAEQQTAAKKRSIVMGYAVQAAELEAQCDSAVNDVLRSLRAELRAIGADTSIVDTLKQTYNSEKAAQKAYYMGLL